VSHHLQKSTFYCIDPPTFDKDSTYIGKYGLFAKLTRERSKLVHFHLPLSHHTLTQTHTHTHTHTFSLFLTLSGLYMVTVRHKIGQRKEKVKKFKENYIFIWSFFNSSWFKLLFSNKMTIFLNFIKSVFLNILCLIIIF